MVLSTFKISSSLRYLDWKTLLKVGLACKWLQCALRGTISVYNATISCMLRINKVLDYELDKTNVLRYKVQ